MKGQSDTKPPAFLKSAGRTQALYNAVSKEVTDMEGKTKTIWEYDYVELEGEVTKAKVMEAIQKNNDVVETVSPDAISIQLSDANSELKLSALTGLTYWQIDTYIDNNVNSLADAKAYLKKLSRVVLAIVKLGTKLD